jgi:phage shock protein E
MHSTSLASRTVVRLAPLVLLASCALGPGTAWAGDAERSTPSAKVAAAAKPAAAQLALMTQEQLLEHQSQHPEHLFVLDVRTPEEFAEGHVPGAVNVPHDQIAARLDQVPKDKDVVLYCRSGRRAGLAAELLAANGYTRLSHLEGDMPAWVERGRPVEK